MIRRQECVKYETLRVSQIKIGPTSPKKYTVLDMHTYSYIRYTYTYTLIQHTHILKHIIKILAQKCHFL